MAKALLIIVVTAFVTATATFVATFYMSSGSLRRAAAARTVEPMKVVPRWIAPAECAPMTADERAQEDLALQVLRTSKGWMHIGAVRHLARDQYHQIDNHPTIVCRPKDMDAVIAELALSQRTFAGSYLYADSVRLARRLGPRDPQIVEAVARTAFREYPIETEYPELKEDIRSLARITLAEFGETVAPWSEPAFKAMNGDDVLGSSAAAIAVATGHPRALEMVSAMLDAILAENSKDPISRAARDRFYGLAYALAAAGPKAQSYAGPVVRIMGRTVQSWAPPFGMLALKPRRMCRVLDVIGGAEADAARAGEACHPKVDVFEQ